MSRYRQSSMNPYSHPELMTSLDMMTPGMMQSPGMMPTPGMPSPMVSPLFIQDLREAINGEAQAIDFYKRLIEMAPNQRHVNYLTHIRNDEKKHLRMLTNLYVQLTGRRPDIRFTPVRFTTYREGLEKALDGELEAAELYRRMYLSVQDRRKRDVLFEIMTDEMEHQVRFAYLIDTVH
ncbi:ferritin-like domain-containing protein [Microaerobacter geothermalis]|uniref:ferritin-like domain-containing protein n=1 Tax=Microaerobacter geothermalis TaxID=674972 RepID=UPI001F2962E9|nr:ferritin-like domain-containing protein [Microaerobacter geothermalis]MCF6093937.1 ferritin-like domain-containing protein [Microaerobacter geothermalis]